MESAAKHKTFQLDSVVRGHHVYKSIWTPNIGQVLETAAEVSNTEDSHAVAVLYQGSTVSVGHVPREISKISWFFLWHGGDISCEVVGRRRRSPILGTVSVGQCLGRFLRFLGFSCGMVETFHVK